MPLTIPDDQETLKAFLNRRHPQYAGLAAHWDFMASTYEGGRKWFETNLFKYVKEGEEEYKARKERGYRFNHTREIVDLVNKYIFKSEIHRKEDAPKVLKDFWEKSTKSGQDVRFLARLIGKKTSVFGLVWIGVDTTVPQSAVSILDVETQGGRVYAYVLTPNAVLDFSYGDDGELDWILIQECRRDDGDPITSSGEIIPRWRLWMRDEWYVFELVSKVQGQEPQVELVNIGENPLGEIPLFAAPHMETDELYEAPALINDIAYLDRAVANYLSNLDAIIQDQTFSQLVIPAQALQEDEEAKLIEFGTKRIFTYDGEAQRGPEYISPDPKQASMVLTVVNKIISEIYHSVGMAGERTKQDNAMGIDNSSGVAKAYDFERMNAMLASKAAALESAENKICKLVLKWNDQVPDDTKWVIYPQDFDVRGLQGEFDIANELALIEAPATVRQEQLYLVVEKIFPYLSAQMLKTMKDDIKKNWPPVAPAPGSQLQPPSLLPAAKGASRQGQVTAETP